ncbi:glycosyltransferase [Psychrobacter piscatorii]|jgi:glycosyltransferase involved in cell wall biosynthesis|uniref:glycosyltransferase n=1 Tax=Psychrobacter piscatorii TaxID=554343 RepID=UPI003735A6DC
MNQHKKIALLVINCLQGGGAERVVLTLGQGFHELGYEVHVLRFKPLVEYDLNSNLNYHILKFKPYKLIPGSQRRDKIFARAVDKYILKEIGNPNIILSNLDRADSIMSNSEMPNIMYVIHTTLSLSHQANQTSESYKSKQKLINRYSKYPCICVSKGVQEDFINYLGDITPITTINNPIDKVAIEKMANAFVPDYKNYIVHVGSFKEAKRHDILLKAYAQTDMSLQLLILGKGKLKREIEALIIELGLEGKAILVGFHDNAFPYVKNASFEILTSNREGFPLVIAEALAIGIPVISTDCQSGPSEMLPAKNLMLTDDIHSIKERLNQAMKDPNQFKSDFDVSLLPIKVAKKYLEFMDSNKQEKNY